MAEITKKKSTYGNMNYELTIHLLNGSKSHQAFKTFQEAQYQADRWNNRDQEKYTLDKSIETM